MFSLKEVARAAGGRVDGDESYQVRRISSLENAAPDALAFYTARDAAHARALEQTSAGAVLICEKFANKFPRHRIIVDDAYLAYARVSKMFAQKIFDGGGIHATAIVAKNATVHENASLGEYVLIGENCAIKDKVKIGGHVSIGDDCVIGENTVIDAGVNIGANTRIGKNCKLSSGVVIGADGFGYAENKHATASAAADGETRIWTRIEQLGGVTIGDDVDIGANTTIDRGAIDDTVIGDGVKLDNHIQIAHNVRVGDDTIMASCVAVAGSAVIGARCRIGGCSGVLGHLEIADDVHLNADSVVINSIRKAGIYSSMISVQPAKQWRRTAAHIHRLDSLAAQIKTSRKNPEQNS